MRNRHIMFITIEHRNLEIRKHVTTSCSGTKPFYKLWVKGFDIRRRDTILLCCLIHLAPISCDSYRAQIHLLRRSPKVDRLVWCLNFNSLTFFKSPTNLRALPVRDVTRTLSSRSVISGYCDISEWHVRPTRALPPTSRFAPN